MHGPETRPSSSSKPLSLESSPSDSYTAVFSRLLAALDEWTLPGGQRDPRTHLRARLISRVSLLGAALALAMAPVLYFTHDSPQVAIFNVVYGCMLLLSPLLLRRSASVELTTHWILANAYSVLVYETFLLGGVESSPFTWLVTLPFGAVLLGGPRCATTWGHVTAASILVIVGLQNFGWLGDPSLPTQALANRGVSTALLTLMIAYIGRLQEEQITQLIGVLTNERSHFRRAAMRDPLTGLGNRSLLEDRLAGVIARSRRSKRGGAIYYLDLDGFKDVNDRHGHRVGDLLLKTVAARLRSQTRASDSLLRIGGDEFVILVEELEDHSTAGKLAEKLATLISSPAWIEGAELRVGISIGVAMIDRESEPESLLHAADTAMYRAKRNGEAYRFAESPS